MKSVVLTTGMVGKKRVSLAYSQPLAFANVVFLLIHYYFGCQHLQMSSTHLMAYASNVCSRGSRHVLL